MKLKIQFVEGFHTTIWKQPIEIETDDYPELKGLDEDEALKYISNKSNKLPGVPGTDADEWSLYDELAGQENELVKEKCYETSIELWIK